MMNCIDGMNDMINAFASGERSPDDPYLVRFMESVEALRDALGSRLADDFVRDLEPSVSRETIEEFGLNWKELMVKRQEYWNVRMASHGDEVLGPNDSAQG